MKTNSALFALSFAALLTNLPLHAGSPPPEKMIQQPETESWEFKLGLPAWVATARGDVGFNGSTSHSNIGFNELANKIDMAGSFRAEASKGRFGILADFSYFSLSDSVG